MEPILGSSVCLICFEMIEKHIVVPSDVPEKLFINCNKYLHSTLSTVKDIELQHENQVPLCKKCFDSALELTQLSEQLTSIQKDISDLTVEFSMAVFHRRSQVYSIGQSCQTSSIVEFNEACLPPNLFSMKLGHQIIHPHEKNQEMEINYEHFQTDISNVKCEGSDAQFDHLSENAQQSVAKDSKNHSKRYVDLDPNNGVELTMSESEKMPKIILERIKIVGHKFEVSARNSNQTNCESREKHLDETLLKDDEFSVHPFDPKRPGDGKILKCFYCERTFAQECHRTLHHKTHTREDIYKHPLVKNKFVYRGNQKTCQITPTGKIPFYKCCYCEKGFSMHSDLRIHERCHTGERPFKCSFCSSRFTNSSNLKSHERTHTGEKPFKCSFCSSRFPESGKLKRHERTHTGEKPFKCSFCNSRFNQSSNLRTHERTHTGEKPYKCLYCEKTFSRIDSKNSHQKCHPEQMSTVVSQVVSYNDGSLGHLKHREQMHSSGHTEFKCSFCEITFSQDEERANHEKIHRREDAIVNENFIVGI